MSDQARAWREEPPEEGVAIARLPHVRDTNGFVSGDPKETRFAFSHYQMPDGSLLSRGWFGQGAEGPPGHAHGGAVAALLDECMGGMILLSGKVIVAARLEIDYRKMVPLGAPVEIEAKVLSCKGRKVKAICTLRSADQNVLSEGQGLFVELEGVSLEDLRGSP